MVELQLNLAIRTTAVFRVRSARRVNHAVFQLATREWSVRGHLRETLGPIWDPICSQAKGCLKKMPKAKKMC